MILKYGIRNIEASGFMTISDALVKYRVDGIKEEEGKSIYIPNKIIGKISRPEMAEMFMSPPPDRIIKRLLERNEITAEEAEISKI